MFKLLELVADIQELRDLGLTDEEIEGYMDMFLENYDCFDNTEIV